MSEANRKAHAAKVLLSDATFNEVLKELQESATNVFRGAQSTPEQIMAAHQKIQAAQTILDHLESWITDKAFQDKREEISTA